jgi:hypothetical protein
VIAKVTGDMTRELAAQIAEDSNVLGAEIGVRCYLIDVTESRNVDSVANNYQYARTDARSPGVDRRACIAVLASEDDDSHDFYVTMAQTAGLEIELFRDRAEAVAHLKEWADLLPPLHRR